MIISNTEPAMVANRWYPLPKNARGSYKSYPTPQSILRMCLGESNYKFVCETVTSEHIRAAAILPLDIPFNHLLNEPWAMNFRHTEWRMIMVSTMDPMRWISIAKASGAIAWLKGHNMTYVYQWEPPVRDATGNKIRPPNAPVNDVSVDLFVPTSKKREYKKSSENFDRTSLIVDIKAGVLTQSELMSKYEMTRSHIIKICDEIGISRERVRKKRNDTGKQKKNYSRADVVSDLIIGNMNHTEIGKKHDISRITVLKIAHEENIRVRER